MEENKIQTMKLYSPLIANFFPNEEEGYEWDEGMDSQPIIFSGEELRECADTIQERVDQENNCENWDGNLMEYFDEKRNPGVKEKVIRAQVSVEEHHGELCGCTTVIMREPLTESELSDLKEYMRGQFSDGWGEGFEQRDIAVSGGVLNVHFWQPKNFSFEMEMPGTASPALTDPRPEMHLVGMDGNIYSIMGRASSLLRANGQSSQAKEMCDRVGQCPNYHQALKVIGEYVKTELSDLPKREPKKKDRGDAR